MTDTTLAIKRFIVEEFMPDVPAEALPGDYDLLDGGVIDSLGLLQMIAWLEDEFQIPLDEADIAPENLRTIAAIEAFIAQQRPGADAA